MNLKQHKEKILAEFEKEFQRDDGIWVTEPNHVRRFLSQALDSTAEITFKAVKPEKGAPLSNFDDLGYGFNEAIRKMENNFNQFKDDR